MSRAVTESDPGARAGALWEGGDAEDDAHDGAAPVVVAVDAGGTYFKSGLVEGTGVLAGTFVQHPVRSQGSREEILAAYASVLSANLDAARRRRLRVAGIGVSTPGPFDYRAGCSLMRHKFQAIRGLPLPPEMRRRVGLPPDLPFAFLYDCHAFLLGEHAAGAARGFRNAAAVTLGTGLGMSALADGRILHDGRFGPHPDYVIYNRPYGDAILEERVSSRGILRRYAELAGGGAENGSGEGGAGAIRGGVGGGVQGGVKELADRALAGDRLCLRVFAETAEVLADQLAPILRRLEAECLLLGGQISKSFDLLGPPLKSRLQPAGVGGVEVRRAESIDHASLLGVARHVLSRD